MLKRLMCALFILVGSAAQAYMPQSGTWIVTSELNGKPGRGIALDVQDNILVMQMYAYEANGQPTFYLGVGTVEGNDSHAGFPLKRYTGGRYFGSAARTGVEDATVGTVQLRFTSGTAGFATFPGEPEVAISRFNFAYSNAPSSLLGIWGFLSDDGSGKANLGEIDFLDELRPPTSTGTGIVTTRDGLFACEHKTSGTWAGGVFCARLSGSRAILRSYGFHYSVNDGEGAWFNPTGEFAAILFVKRLAPAAGNLTGIIFSGKVAHEKDFDATTRAFDEAYARAQPR